MRYEELVQYKREHGNTLVPVNNYLDNPQLGRWVHRQRQNRKTNKLAPKRVDKLNSIGFIWDPFEAAWEEMFQELEQYYHDHGHTLVPANCPKNPQLGMWVGTQRKTRKENQLAPERVDKLNEIDFVWDAIEAAWEEMFQQLTQYKNENGDMFDP